MKLNKKLLAKCIAIPVVLGIVSSLLTMGGMKVFNSTMNQPPLSPPMWLFPVVWTLLYVMMGTASYLVYTSEKEAKELSNAMSLYAAQLVVNFLWPIFFFHFQWYLLSFFWLLLLWVLVFLTTRQFYNISRLAGYLMVPYLVWLTFAAYLTLGVWWLN